MILKASQRGGALQLAWHLQRTDVNDHVEVHDLRGFSADTLTGALHEIAAISKGTRCKQPLFSLSLNPPDVEDVPIKVFEDAIDRVGKKLGLSGQARAIVFHEKDGRRHAHAVWSRIDVQEMKAINLSHFKLKLKDISKGLYLEHGWQLPEGLQDKNRRNPMNFSREEWQQAKRAKQNPHELKAMFRECWSISDNQGSFAKALEERGFFLAQGRRGFVALDYRGEIYAVSRWTGKKAKEVRAKLGSADSLPSAEQTKEEIGKRMSGQVKRYISDVEQALEAQSMAITFKKAQMKLRQNVARQQQREQQALRWTEETQERANRFRKGFRGLWDRLTGTHGKIRKQNEQESRIAEKRDIQEREKLISSQLKERRALQTELKALKTSRSQEHSALKADVAHYLRMAGKASDAPQRDQSLAPEIQRPFHRRHGQEHSQEIEL